MFRVRGVGDWGREVGGGVGGSDDVRSGTQTEWVKLHSANTRVIHIFIYIF